MYLGVDPDGAAVTLWTAEWQIPFWLVADWWAGRGGQFTTQYRDVVDRLG